MKNWEGYFLNSYSVKILASEWEKDEFTESKNFCTESQAAQAEVLPFWLYIDIYINTMFFILALLHQIESFHRLQIKPNKLDLSLEKWTLKVNLWLKFTFSTWECYISFDSVQNW